MNPFTFSVIIPAYNNAEYLGEAIQSVLNQSYQDYELIIVNDASPDNTYEIVSQFHDDRIKYIVHDKNQGLSAARNTGISASRGEWIALLDGDDFFHPDKLKLHNEFATKNPDVGVTYNPRFELNHSAKTIRDIWRPPLRVTLYDLVQGFPFGPSDMVAKREWMFRVGLFDVCHTYVGEDLDINCRLALAGCTFLSVDKALNYRRYYSGRLLKNLRSCIEDTIRPLDRTFADPNCPSDVFSIRDIAYSKHYVLWSIIAILQGEIDLGQEILLKASRCDQTLLTGNPCRFVDIVVSWCTMDDSADHEKLIIEVLNNLPTEFAQLANARDWAVSRGFFIKGVRDIIWGRYNDGQNYLRALTNKDFHLDDRTLNSLISQLQNFGHEFDEETSEFALNELSNAFIKNGLKPESQHLRGAYYFNRALKRYRKKEFQKVPGDLRQAFFHDPRYISNRGALSMLVRSIPYLINT